MIKDFKEAYQQGRLDEKIKWKISLRELLNAYPNEEYVSKKYIIKLYEEEGDLGVVRIPKQHKEKNTKQHKSK